MAYVAWYCEHLRDGHEDGAKVTGTLEEALKVFDSIRNHGLSGGNYSFKLFELGKEIPIEQAVVEEPQPSKKTYKFKRKRN